MLILLKYIGVLLLSVFITKIILIVIVTIIVKIYKERYSKFDKWLSTKSGGIVVNAISIVIFIFIGVFLLQLFNM